MSGVLSIDFNDYIAGNERRKQFCADLVKSLTAFGFVKIQNHEVGRKTIDEAFAWNREFFGLPHDQKMKAEHPPQSNPHRGYSYVGQESLSALNRADRGLPRLHELKEAWDQGAPDDPENDNLWPDPADIPGFREFMEGFFDSCHTALLTLLRACAIGFNLPELQFEHKLNTRVHELRLLHYPPVEAKVMKDSSMTRASDHTDFGLLTLLWQDSVGGLEIEDQDHERVFHPVKTEPGEMIVNVGDSLMRWTNGHLHAGVHRVVLQPPNSDDPHAIIPGRRSLVFFGKPDRDGSVGPVKELLAEDEVAKYPEMTAGEYNQSRLVRVYG